MKFLFLLLSIISFNVIAENVTFTVQTPLTDTQGKPLTDKDIHTLTIKLGNSPGVYDQTFDLGRDTSTGVLIKSITKTLDSTGVAFRYCVATATRRKVDINGVPILDANNNPILTVPSAYSPEQVYAPNPLAPAGAPSAPIVIVF